MSRIVKRSDFAGLAARAQAQLASGSRRVLGIAGAPAAGKSTLAAQLVDELDGRAILVPMDGFHLAAAELDRLGRQDRKGAIDTFDVGGYVALLRRLSSGTEDEVYAPTFRRDLEEPIAGSIRVSRSVQLVVTEGNYLLADVGEWAAVRGLLDEAWFLDPPEQTRIERLIRRHLEFGRDDEAARSRATGSDQRNADFIATTKSRADVIVAG